MATIVKVKRLHTSRTNPRQVTRRPRAASKVRHQKRRLSPKQVAIFGTKAQKAALRRSRAQKRAGSSASSHRPRTMKRRPNPWLITLAPAAGINPHQKRRNTVAARKRKHPRRTVAVKHKRRRRVVASNRRRHTRRNPRVRHHRRRSAPKVVVRYRTRRRNGRRRAVARRNPDIFGARLGSKDSLKMIGGGIAGVAATKFLPTLLPAGTLASVASSNLGKTAISIAAALAAGWAASKLDPRFGQGVYFGGLMQATSVALNAFLPSIYRTLNIGMGDFVPGQFAVPQNPVRGQLASPHMPSASGARVTMSGLARAYAPAY